MTGNLATDPATVEIATPELIPLGVDFAARLTGIETVTNVVSVTVVHTASGTAVPTALSGSSSLVGSVVTQMIDGAALTSGAHYRYVVTVLIGSRREATTTTLAVVF